MANDRMIQAMVDEAKADAGFNVFVDKVAPRVKGVQQVFFAELYLILQILWEIYTWMKKLGWFDRWLKTSQVRRAMKLPTRAAQERELQKIRVSLTKVVPV